MQLSTYELEGSPFEMGLSFGEQCRDEIQRLCRIRLRLARVMARQEGRKFSDRRILELCQECLEVTRDFDAAGYEEMRGVAEGSGLSMEEVFALNGLTDLKDVLSYGQVDEGCSSFMVAGDRSDSGKLLLGQNWDLYTSNKPFVCLVHRKPSDAPETWCLTTTGCLSLIGVNSEGIAVGNTNLRTSDSRIGVQYLSVLHKALSCSSFETAVETVAASPRSGAHYYYVAGPQGTAVGIECSAQQHHRFEIREGTFVHCNHFLEPELARLQTEEPSESTCARQLRLTELLNEKQKISVDSLKDSLSDHANGENAICRHHGADAVSTNACVILSPETREIHACRGQPHVGKWEVRMVGEEVNGE
ncbi:MAG: C45 family autoproteolytic acyltransferase/hydrolase [Planctomycetota bacterium]|nr:C45 family autoproteolytic acyltransferase/hydrolase [Planctomycetota bacterium]